MNTPIFKDKNHLIPVVVQDAYTLQVLMLAYTNEETWRLTLEEGRAVFFSRSRQTVWRKGETSGNTLKVESWKVDCDGDTLLLKVLPAGPACHRGTMTCFDKENETTPETKFGFLSTLWACIEQRKEEAQTTSYTYQLLQGSLSRAAQKVGEEGLEVALAAVQKETNGIREESADLLYHLLVLWKKIELEPESVMEILKQRHTSSGPRNAQNQG
jgi:phosphoribosyl-ATP pyrophosphohydrolase/phosphoribosyl-AMP cyclohydrolase